MALAIRRPSSATAARALAAVIVVSLLAMAQLMHLPASHGHDTTAARAVDAAMVAGTDFATPGTAMTHDLVDCSGTGCGACAAFPSAAVVAPGIGPAPRYSLSAFRVMAQAPQAPFRPPTHPV